MRSRPRATPRPAAAEIAESLLGGGRHHRHPPGAAGRRGRRSVVSGLSDRSARLPRRTVERLTGFDLFEQRSASARRGPQQRRGDEGEAVVPVGGRAGGDHRGVARSSPS